MKFIKYWNNSILLPLLSLALVACVSTDNGSKATDNQQTKATQKTGSNASNKLSIQGFNNVILFSIPLDWQTTEAAYQASDGKQAILEFVPKDESIEDWSEFLSLNAFANLPQEATPTGYFERMYANNTCKGERIFEPMIRGKVMGYDSASIIYGCSDIANAANSTRRSELGYLIVIEANNKDFYILYRAMRGQSLEELSNRLNKENYQTFISDIAPIGIQ